MKFIRDPYSFKIAVRSYQLQNKTEVLEERNLIKIGWEPIYQGKTEELVVHMSVSPSIGSTPNKTSLL